MSGVYAALEEVDEALDIEPEDGGRTPWTRQELTYRGLDL